MSLAQHDNSTAQQPDKVNFITITGLLGCLLGTGAFSKCIVLHALLPEASTIGVEATAAQNQLGECPIDLSAMDKAHLFSKNAADIRGGEQYHLAVSH